MHLRAQPRLKSARVAMPGMWELERKTLDERWRTALETRAVESDTIAGFNLWRKSRMALHRGKEGCARRWRKQVHARRAGNHTLGIHGAVLWGDREGCSRTRIRRSLHCAMVFAVSPAASGQIVLRRATCKGRHDRCPPKREHYQQRREGRDLPHIQPVGVKRK